MRVTIIGCGHVGLVAGVCLADIGHDVTCVDIDKAKIDLLTQGVTTIYEPRLEGMMRCNLENGRVKFSTDLAEGIRSAEIVIITTGTPAKEDDSPDLSYVEEVARGIAPHLGEYKLIVEKSTVPVKTGERIKRTIHLYGGSEADFDIASVPEFLREGSAVEDFLHPDRIVIGVETSRAEKLLRKLFAPIETCILVTDIKTAELIKHASNSFLALKISYINAISNICEFVGVDTTKVAEGMGLDKRIGRQFLNAGIGYGGSCFPKDVAALRSIAAQVGYSFDLLESVETINLGQRQLLIDKVKDALWVLTNKTIGILGLAFKPNTDDVRESPALDIIRLLQTEKAHIKVYDPAAMENMKALVGDSVDYCENPYDAARDADALVLLTEWEEFRNLDMGRIKELLRVPILVDGRNFFCPAEVRRLGFEYYGIGR